MAPLEELAMPLKIDRTMTKYCRRWGHTFGSNYDGKPMCSRCCKIKEAGDRVDTFWDLPPDFGKTTPSSLNG